MMTGNNLKRSEISKVTGLAFGPRGNVAKRRDYLSARDEISTLPKTGDALSFRLMAVLRFGFAESSANNKIVGLFCFDRIDRITRGI
jgi:hypothetical protein